MKLRNHLALLVLAALTACSTPANVSGVPNPAMPPTWEEQTVSEPPAQALPRLWWQALQDPVVERLMSQARFTSVEQALARVDEARAQLGQQQASSRPQLLGAVNAQRGLEQNEPPQVVSRAGPSLQLGWEIDLWGRVAQGRAAAEQRSAQQSAQAELAALLAQVQLVDWVVQERACRRMVELQTADEQSWTSSLEMQRVRLRFGAQSMQGLARTEGQAAAQRIQLAATEAQCHGLRQALRALAGVEPAVLTSAIALERPDWVKPPLLRSEQPASVLLKHAQMRAATAAADAAFHDLGSAQAARLPSLNLAGLLGHQWVRMLGHDSELKPWSESIALAGPLWDGGAGTARVEAAQARLNGAMANLDQTLRQTVREIETALAQQEAMYRQLQAALQYAQSSDQSWRVSQAAAAAGRLNSLDLEDAARQQRIAQLALVAAQRDLDLAWTGLVKAAGQAPLHFETPP